AMRVSRYKPALRQFSASAFICVHLRFFSFRKSNYSAEINFIFCVLHNFEASAAQHGFGAGAIRYPPIGLVSSEVFFDAMHFWKTGLIEYFRFFKRIIAFEFVHFTAAALHRLEEHLLSRDVFADEIEREQWMAQVIKNAHENYEVEFL